MLKTICTLLLLSLASGARAQGSGDDPTDNKNAHQTWKPVGPAIEPGTTDSALKIELDIGDPAPDFSLDGSGGQPVRLADLKGHWSMIVFAEGRTALAPLKDIDADLARAGVTLYGVCRDAAPTLKTYAEREQLPFTLLSDMTRQISEIYGMYDEDADVIQPGIVLIDPKGVVRMALLGQSLHPSEVLQLARHVVTGA